MTTDTDPPACHTSRSPTESAHPMTYAHACLHLVATDLHQAFLIDLTVGNVVTA
ncbi:MAG: hypothetical protein K2Q97_10615 [Burkholderiaceae bacterium]|nr:hypothetical protein [Burkholderiaceae bacterium]